MFSKNRKHRDRNEAEFEYPPTKLTYEPELYNSAPNTSSSQPPGSWIDPPPEPRRGPPALPPSRPHDASHNRFDESFETHRQPSITTRPENTRSPQTSQPNFPTLHSEASKSQQSHQSSTPIQPESYGAPPVPYSRHPPTPAHTPSNSNQSINLQQAKFVNQPPSPTPTEPPPRTTESPKKPTESPQKPTESTQKSTESPRKPTESPQKPTIPPKSSKPIRLTAHEPAPYLPKGTEQQEWDDVLGSWSLRDDKESQFLDVVDAIRDHDLDRQLSLPQLVVCGKQSSGKSSVLEAITRVPFPRGDTTCTRFVTEIRLIPDRSLLETSITASISADPSRTDRERAVLARFKATYGPREFEKLVQDASRAMGLTEDGSENHVKFAGDILCVEIRGPRSPRLTIVDLPGLIAVNQGEEDDIRIVEAITDRYIKDERSIILPVVNADVNVQDHGILEKARAVDPEGKRTFGIITKPDRIEAGLPNETEWLKLARQADDAFFKFGKGCHVLVNRSGQKTKDGTSSAERDKHEEAFFTEEIWATDSGENSGKPNRWHILYETNQWGVGHLIPRLKTLLYNHTQEQIGTLRSDIQARLKTYDARLEQLSLGLLDPEQMMDLLSERFGSIAKTTSQAVLGTYRTDPDFFGMGADNKTGRYLRGRIRDENSIFHDQMKSKGHRKEYAVAPDDTPPEDFTWVDKFHRFLLETVGTELPGNFDPYRTTQLFHHYSDPWKNLSAEYLRRANDHCREFMKLVINKKLGREFPDIASSFRRHVMEERLQKRLRQAEKELAALERDRGGDLVTENIIFLARSSEKFATRLAKRIKNAEKQGSFPPDSPEHTAMSIGLGEPEGKRQEAAIQMMEEMLIYYNIARDRYIDNVIIQVVERHLLDNLDGEFRTDWMRKPEIFNRVTLDPHLEGRRRERDEIKSRRENLWECFIALESLEG